MATKATSAYLSAADSFADLVDRIDPAMLAGPGLGEWDLRALVGHTSRSLVTVLTYLDQPATSEDVASAEDYYVQIAGMSFAPGEIAERGRQAGAQLGEDPAAAVGDLVTQVRTKLAATDPDALITTIAGGMTVRAYLPTRTFELVVHGLDIERATGLSVGFASDALAEATELAARVCVLSGQAPTLLAALTGRSPLPDGFSVVP